MKFLILFSLLTLSGCFLQEKRCDTDDIGSACEREGREGVCSQVATIGRPVCLLDSDEINTPDAILDFNVAGRPVVANSASVPLPRFDNLTITWRANTTTCTLTGPDFESVFAGSGSETFSPNVTHFGQWTLTCGDASLTVEVEEDFRPLIREFVLVRDDGSTESPLDFGVVPIAPGQGYSVRWLAFNVTTCTVSGETYETETLDGITANRGEIFAFQPLEWVIRCEAPGFNSIERRFTVFEERPFYLEAEGETNISAIFGESVEVSFRTNAEFCSYALTEEIEVSVGLVDERGTITIGPSEDEFENVVLLRCTKGDEEPLTLAYFVYYVVPG